MKPSGLSQIGERAALHMAPNEEAGGFFETFSRPSSVGRVALIHGIPLETAHEIYEGNLDLLYDTYLIPNPNQPGCYDLDNGATVKILVNPGNDWEPGNMTRFYEFSLVPPEVTQIH